MNATLWWSWAMAMVLAGGVVLAAPAKPAPTAPARPAAPLNQVPPSLAGQDREQNEVIAEPVPPQVVAGAVAAVEKLGEEVVLGRYHVAVERMYPVWKERAAKRLGGADVLEKQLANVAAEMVQQGVSIISFKPQGAPRPYEVAPGTVAVKEDGVTNNKLMYTKWLVLVPTLRKIRIMREGNPKPVVIESTGFQVAVCDKGKNNWTFIDGADLTLNDLRGLFLTLPQNMQLPPVEQHESR